MSLGIPPRAIFFDEVNSDLTLPIKIYTFKGREAISENIREMVEGENLIGTGTLAGLGTKLIKLETGFIELLGRKEYEDNYNRMLFGTFVCDENGRLMYIAQ